MNELNYMFVILFSLVTIISLILEKRFFSSIRTPISFFSVLWSVVGAVANMGIYGYNPPSFFVNITIFVSIILFQVFFYFFVNNRKHDVRNTDNMKITGNVNYKIVYLVNFMSLLYMLPHTYKALKIISTNGYSYLRAVVSDTSLGISTSGMQNSIIDSFIRPIFITTAVLSVIIAFSDKESKKNKIQLILFAVITNSCMAITTAGRAPIVNFVFYFIIAFILFRGKYIFRSILKEKAKLGLCLALFALVIYLTNQRSLNGSDSVGFLKTTYIYYFSGPSYLTELLKNQTEYGLGGKYLWGTATFGFISNFVSYFLMLLTGKKQGSLYLMGSVITNKYYYVTPDVLINAMCTCFYNFLIDWGYFGIFLGPLIMAFLSYVLFKKAYKSSNVLSWSLYLYWLYVLTRTLFKWDLLNLDFTVIYFTLIIFTYQSNEKKLLKQKLRNKIEKGE